MLRQQYIVAQAVICWAANITAQTVKAEVNIMIIFAIVFLVSVALFLSLQANDEG